MKKVIAIILVFVLSCGFFWLGDYCYAAGGYIYIEGGDTYDTATLLIDQDSYVKLVPDSYWDDMFGMEMWTSGSGYFKFIPAESGDYTLTIRGRGESEPYSFEVYYDNQSPAMGSWYLDYDQTFQKTITVEAGHTYYIYMNTVIGTKSTTYFTINFDKPLRSSAQEIPHSISISGKTNVIVINDVVQNYYLSAKDENGRWMDGVRFTLDVTPNDGNIVVENDGTVTFKGGITSGIYTLKATPEGLDSPIQTFEVNVTKIEAGTCTIDKIDDLRITKEFESFSSNLPKATIRSGVEIINEKVTYTCPSLETYANIYSDDRCIGFSANVPIGTYPVTVSMQKDSTVTTAFNIIIEETEIPPQDYEILPQDAVKVIRRDEDFKVPVPVIEIVDTEGNHVDELFEAEECDFANYFVGMDESGLFFIVSKDIPTGTYILPVHMSDNPFVRQTFEIIILDETYTLDSSDDISVVKEEDQLTFTLPQITVRDAKGEAVEKELELVTYETLTPYILSFNEDGILVVSKDIPVGNYKIAAKLVEDESVYKEFTLTVSEELVQETYTVTFIDHDGAEIKTETVEHGSSAIAPADPTREGYTFVDWDVDFSNVTEDVTVTAQYSINQYNISFDSNSASLVAPITANYSSTIIEPDEPTKEGYIFAGWYKEESLENRWNFESDTVATEDITLYAKWVTPQESITMNASPNSVEVSDNFNETVTLYIHRDTVIEEVYAEDLSFSGAFRGLSIGEVNSTSTTVTASVYGMLSNVGIGTITLNADKLAIRTSSLSADITVIAKPTYTVIFKDYDGRVLEIQQVEDGSNATAPDNPTRNGYTFTGWNTSFTNVTSDITVMATYRKNSSTSRPDRDKTTETAESGMAVVVNGKAQTAGTEVVREENGERTVELSINTEILSKKIDQVLKENEASGKTTENVVEILVATKDTNTIKSILTGDMVKKMEENNFTLSVNTDKIDYIIPAKEIDIEQVAINLGIKLESLEEIKVEVQIEKANEAIAKEIMGKAKTSGYDILFPPVEFRLIAKSNSGKVNETKVSKFSSYVQRVVEVSEEIDPDKITTGIVYNADGTFSHIPTSVFEEDGKWYAKLNSLTNSSYSVIWNPITVKSVENHWSKKYVNDMASRLVIKGPETFVPDESITRSEFAEYITKALGLYRTGFAEIEIFSDVTLSHEAFDAITIAAEYGIINGYPDGTFRPDSKISREEAMVMYAKAMDIAGLKGEDNDKMDSYTDKKEIAAWAFEAVKKTVSVGVFNGKTNITIDPKGTFTYAEAVTAIRNLLTKTGLIDE